MSTRLCQVDSSEGMICRGAICAYAAGLRPPLGRPGGDHSPSHVSRRHRRYVTVCESPLTARLSSACFVRPCRSIMGRACTVRPESHRLIARPASETSARGSAKRLMWLQIRCSTALNSLRNCATCCCTCARTHSSMRPASSDCALAGACVAHLGDGPTDSAGSAPALTLVISSLAGWMLTMRNSMITTIEQA
jgi:hypothetical protein